MPKKKKQKESDSVYLLKLILFFILGSIWFRFVDPAALVPGIPVGLIIGLLFASHDHFMIDRKVEFAILLAAAFLSFVAPVGIVITA